MSHLKDNTKRGRKKRLSHKDASFIKQARINLIHRQRHHDGRSRGLRWSNPWPGRLVTEQCSRRIGSYGIAIAFNVELRAEGNDIGVDGNHAALEILSRCRVAITAAIFSGVSRSFHDKTTLTAFRRRRFFRDQTTGFKKQELPWSEEPTAWKSAVEP